MTRSPARMSTYKVLHVYQVERIEGSGLWPPQFKLVAFVQAPHANAALQEAKTHFPHYNLMIEKVPHGQDR